MSTEKKWGVSIHNHHKHGRINAAEKCKMEGWGPSTILHSEAWQVPRRVFRVPFFGSGVTVIVLRGSGKVEEMNTFPGDVHKKTLAEEAEQLR